MSKQLLKIDTGINIVGHLCTLDEFAGGQAARVLVGGYADATGLDVHVAESHVVEVRRLRQADDAPKMYELRVAGITVASAREVKS